MPYRDVVLRNAHLPEQEYLHDVTVRDGVIVQVQPARDDNGMAVGETTQPISTLLDPTDVASSWNLEGRLLLPGLVDIHTHIDKALTISYTDNPDGTLEGAIRGYQEFELTLTADDVYQRALETAEMALSHGTTTIRTHVNFGADGTAFERSLEALNAARRVLAGRLDLQIVPMFPMIETEAGERLLNRCADDLIAIGGAPHLSATSRENMEWIVSLAQRYDLGVDVHVDEQLSASARTLEHLAELVSGWSSSRPVVAGHCVSLDVMPVSEAWRIAQQVAASGIAVVTLPGANLFLQGRRDETGVRRGVTRVKMLQEAGVQVCAASDNIQDVFHPYGRGDLLDAALLTAYAAHFQPEDAEKTLAMISQIPGRVAIDPNYGIVPGQTADLVVLDATTPLEALQTLAPSRWVFKGGRCVAVRRSHATCLTALTSNQLI